MDFRMQKESGTDNSSGPQRPPKKFDPQPPEQKFWPQLPQTTFGPQPPPEQSPRHKLRLERNASGIHIQFANLQTTIESASDYIKKDVEIFCLGGSIPSPYNFYAVPYAIWNDLEQYMRKIQLAYNILMHGSLDFTYMDSVPNPKFLVSGLYVVVYYEKEFHRARILKQEPFENDEPIYKVRLIDYGDTINAKFSEILYLMKCFTAFPSAAFRCQLLVKNRPGQDHHKVTLEDMVKKDWTLAQTRAFRSIIYDRPLSIIPTDPVKEEADGEVSWKVYVSVLHKKVPENQSNPRFDHETIEIYLKKEANEY